MPAMVLFRAICFIHARSGECVIPAMHTRRDPTRMNTSTLHVISPTDVQTSAEKKSTAAKTSVWVRMNSRHGVLFSRSGAGTRPCRFKTFATV